MQGVEVSIFSLTVTPISPTAHPACFASLTDGLIPVDKITRSESICSFPTMTSSAFS